jgi:hypothetical protein
MQIGANCTRAKTKRLRQTRCALVRLLVVFISGGLGFGAIFSGGPPVFSGSVAMQVAATVGLRVGGPLMTFSHLLVQLRCSIPRGLAIAR